MTELGPRTKWLPIIASAVCLALAGNPISFATASLFVIPVTKEFGWTRGAFFAGLTVALMISAIILPFIGQLVDRRGSRIAILSGIVGFAACIASLSRLTGVWAAYLTIMAVLGIATMLHGPLPYTRVALASAGGRRGLALAIAMSGSTVGLIAIPPLASWLITSFGWRSAELGLGGLVVLIALPVAGLFIRPQPADEGLGTPATAAPLPFPWFELRNPLFWKLSITFFLNAMAVNAFLGHAAAIAIDRGIPMADGALAVSIAGAGSAIARIAAGTMLDRVNTPQVGQLWFALVALGLLLCAAGHGVMSIFFAAALIGAGFGAEGELIAYFTSRFFERELYGRMYGLILPFFMAGVAFGPLVFATIFDRARNYQLGLYLMAGAQGVGCLILAIIGEYRHGLGGAVEDTSDLEACSLPSALGAN